MDAVIWQGIVVTIGGAIGAGVAGFLSVRFGLAKLRRERAFDRRLDWYERTTRSIYETKSAIDEVIVCIRYDQSDKVLFEWLRKVDPIMTALILNLAEADLYVDKKTREVTRRLRESIDRTGNELASRFTPGIDVREDWRAVLREKCEAWQLYMEPAAEELAGDVRKLLGLKR